MSKPFHVFHFSPCGTTLQVATAIAKGTELDVNLYDLSDPAFTAPILAPNSLAVFACPIYMGLVPEIALNRLQLVDGSNCYAAAVVTYGNRSYDDGLLQLSDVLSGAGFTVIGGAAFVAQHSSNSAVANGKPNADDLSTAEQFGKDLAGKYSASPTASVLPGNRPYKTFTSTGQNAPTTSDACTLCGLCAEKCPVLAINPIDPSQTNKLLCIDCRRCVSICPVGAKQFKGGAEIMMKIALPLLTKKMKENDLFL